MKRTQSFTGTYVFLLTCGTLIAACGGGDGGQTSQTISFTNPGAQTLATSSISLSASASSGLTVSFASTTSAVCSVDGSTVTLLSEGSCSVTANQAGNSSYAAATPVTETFTVSKASQTITFTSPGNQTLGITPAALVATSSSGLDVSFASTTPTVCTVTGTTLTLVSAGQCSVTASQSGNSTYAAAASVTDGFTVAAAAPATLTYLSGYQSASTVEGGGYGGYAGSDSTSSCSNCGGGTGSYSPDVTAANSYYSYSYNPSVAPQWAYIGIYIMAPGLSDFSSTGDTTGIQVVDQTTMKFTLAENSEWYSSGNKNINVVLVMGHLESGNCHINLVASLTPTTAASTSYSVPLSSFSVNQSACSTTTTAAAALAAYPISQIQFQGGGNAGGSAVQSTSTSLYPTQLTLTGGITFQ